MHLCSNLYETTTSLTIQDLTFHDLIPVIVIPSMNFRCAKKNASTTGAIAMTLAAIITAQFVPIWFLNIASPTGSVLITVLWVITNGHRYMFQLHMNVKIPKVRKMLRVSGITI